MNPDGSISNLQQEDISLHMYVHPYLYEYIPYIFSISIYWEVEKRKYVKAQDTGIKLAASRCYYMMFCNVFPFMELGWEYEITTIELLFHSSKSFLISFC